MKWSNITAKDLDKGVIHKLALESTERKRAREPIYWYLLDGKKQLRITMPNTHGGSGAISRGYLKQIRQDLLLTTKQFEELVGCLLKAEDFEVIIRSKLGI